MVKAAGAQGRRWLRLLRGAKQAAAVENQPAGGQQPPAATRTDRRIGRGRWQGWCLDLQDLQTPQRQCSGPGLTGDRDTTDSHPPG